MLRRAPVMRHGNGPLAMEIEHLTHDEATIDFSSASLYLPAVQTVCTTLASALASVVVCWLSPAGVSSAVRTLAITVVVGATPMKAPLQLAPVRGLKTVFASLRPCPLLYVGCLIVQQLSHTCVSEDMSASFRFWRDVLFYGCTLVAAAAGFTRSMHPRSEHDGPFLVVTFTGILIALLPPAALSNAGPLCAPPSLMAAAERVLRATLFACLYVTHVYAAAPISNTVVDTARCVARAFAACVWVVGVHIYGVALAPVQLGLVLWFSFSHSALHYGAVYASRADEERGLTDFGAAGRDESRVVECEADARHAREEADRSECFGANFAPGAPRAATPAFDLKSVPHTSPHAPHAPHAPPAPAPTTSFVRALPCRRACAVMEPSVQAASGEHACPEGGPRFAFCVPSKNIAYQHGHQGDTLFREKLSRSGILDTSLDM